MLVAALLTWVDDNLFPKLPRNWYQRQAQLLRSELPGILSVPTNFISPTWRYYCFPRETCWFYTNNQINSIDKLYINALTEKNPYKRWEWQMEAEGNMRFYLLYLESVQFTGRGSYTSRGEVGADPPMEATPGNSSLLRFREALGRVCSCFMCLPVDREPFFPFACGGSVPGCIMALPRDRRRLTCDPVPPTLVRDTPLAFLELRGALIGLGFDPKSDSFSFIICSWSFFWSCNHTNFGVFKFLTLQGRYLFSL
jgi:hypothetical protein